MRESRKMWPAAVAVFTLAVMLAGARVARAQASPAAPSTRAARSGQALEELSGSLASLAARVAPSVVQVLVTSYGPVDESVRRDTNLVIGRQHSIGSGVVIDAGGYIMTNAHVVSNARRVEVVLPGQAEDGGVRSLTRTRGRTVEATIVGVAREIDLALLKVEGVSLPPLPIADYDKLRQGELVFAFGSPEGLRNSVTMGIVSAVARQQDADNPLVYVQTDASVAHGNSGGPLVNVNGELVGINTFTMSESADAKGPAFAIPGPLVQLAYPKLRRYGHLHRGEIGILLQAVTPTLAAGLSLPQDWGAMISDVIPGSPAATAGFAPGDIVLSIDGEAVDGLPRLAFQFFTRSAGDVVRLKVRRGADLYTADVTAVERPHDFDRLTDLVDPDKSLVAKLGVLGIDLTEANAAMASNLRSAAGVLVVGHTTDEVEAADSGLQTGDAIHSVNGTPVISIVELRAALDALGPRPAIVLQIERNGQMMFLAFEGD
jgi:serine protease Do